jgi:hypothetical protein
MCVEIVHVLPNGSRTRPSREPENISVMGLNGLAQIRLSTLQTLHFSPMKLRDRLEPQRYEQRLQETRWERKAETKQVERLSAILVKKASSAKAKGIPDRAA